MYWNRWVTKKTIYNIRKWKRGDNEILTLHRKISTFHKGHKWCIQQMIEKGKKVCVAVMDIYGTEPENNPYTYDEVLKKISEDMNEEIQRGKDDDYKDTTN